MSAAIFYHADAYDTSRPNLMGRHTAGEGFLAGFARYAQGDPLYCYTRTKDGFRDFHERVQRWNPKPRETRWIPLHRPSALSAPGCLFRPGPSITDFAWQRRSGDQRGHSLCGVTHTIATARIMDSLTDLAIAPIQSWDAIICTSSVVKATVDRVFETWGAYLQDRFGVSVTSQIQLPVIPLGVDCDAFVETDATAKARTAWREKFGAAPDDIVVLFMGRLNFMDKAHPLPMYLGLEETARRTNKRVHLVQAGWFGQKEIEKQFKIGAKTFCPSVNAVFVDGRKPEVRDTIWFAADIFTSLSDNIQETFGLTPIEAMAAGLPVVVSDWDGYRDTVRHGIDGFAVPTVMPPPGFGEDLALRFQTEFDAYGGYIGNVSQCTAIDPGACADAYARLALDPDLRRRMGQAGRKRAREVFDWRVIVGAYEALWSELAARRAVDNLIAPRTPGTPASPAREDPFSLFASYPTRALDPTDYLSIVDEPAAPTLERIRELGMNTYSQTTQADADVCGELLRRIAADGPTTVETIVSDVPESDAAKTYRTLCWLAKTGLVRLEEAETP
jgi:glycosyltransferase involved in cell wall biosynthesis